MCSLTLTDVNDYIDENNDMRQTMSRRFSGDSGCAVELGETFSYRFYILAERQNWIKSSRTKRIKTGMASFDKRDLISSCDNEEWVMYFLNQDRMARILELIHGLWRNLRFVCMGWKVGI